MMCSVVSLRRSHCVGGRSPMTHRQAPRYPFPTHRRFPTQSGCHQNLVPIAFLFLAQFCLRPPSLAQHLPHQSLGLLFVRFSQLLPIMLFALLPSDQLQHLFPEALCSPAPPSPEFRPVRSLFAPLQLLALFHPLLQLPASRRVFNQLCGIAISYHGPGTCSSQTRREMN